MARRQLNIRHDDETEARLARLVARVSAEYGIPVSQADVFRLALQELEKRFPPAAEPGPEKSRRKKPGSA
jgi:hypothetical protein